MIVYKILTKSQDSDYNLYVGKPLPLKIYDNSCKSREKIELETIFEAVRMSDFPSCYPRQKEFFFVFGNIEEEKKWLIEMYSKKTVEYTLATLEIEDVVQWFNVYYYDDAADCNSAKGIQVYAQRYWKSRKDAYSCEKDSLYEGLYGGKNKIKKLEQKLWIGLQNEIKPCNN